MTELSRVWDGTATGDAADASYDSSEFAELLQALAAAEAIPTNKSGVFRGVDNLLGYTIGSNKVTIASGKALVAGRWYRNTAPVDLTIGNATVGRRDRVVLRRDTSAQTVRLTVLTGIDNGSGVAPTMTQDASTWDEPLYIFNKAPTGSGGAITIIADNREYIPRHGDVSGEGAAALHVASQISGLPSSADSAPLNAGLTKTANAGSDSGHYANDDHVHRVDPIPSGRVSSNQVSSGLSVNLTELAFALDVGVTYIVEGGFYITSFGAPNLGVTVGIGIGTMLNGGAIGNDINDPTQIDSVVSAGGFNMGPGYTHFSAIGISTGASAVSFIPYPSGTAAILAGSWLRATPVT
jgi:hypothetical protein